MVSKRFKLVKVSGSNYEMGYQHGEQCSERIQELVKRNLELAQKVTSLTPKGIFTRVEKFIPYIDDFTPHLVEELKGLADGAGVSFKGIVFLNIRGELAYPKAETCTSFAISKERTIDGQVLIGQNVDWHEPTEDAGIILHLKPKTGPTILCWTMAGCLGQTGINSNGLGRVGNGMASIHWRQIGVPYNIILRSVLEQSKADDAVEVIRKAIRAKSSNILLADSSGKILDIEFTAFTDRVLEIENGFLAHSNNYLHPELLKYERVQSIFPDSPKRCERMKEMICEERGKITVSICKKWFQDHQNYPESICRHVRGGLGLFADVKTTASIIGESSKGVLHACVGNPCENEYSIYRI